MKTFPSLRYKATNIVHWHGRLYNIDDELIITRKKNTVIDCYLNDIEGKMRTEYDTVEKN